MSLTRKHFIELAGFVRGGVDKRDKDCVDCIAVLADKLADFCAKHNPDFDRERFLKACELKGEGS